MTEILVIDDESTIRELYGFIFSDAGHSALLAPNGREALKLLETHTPDFMVVDISMPVMTGLEFIVELGKRAAAEPRLDGIPFVVMTGENFIDPGISGPFAARPGFAGYFPKMTLPERILAKAEETMNSRSPAQPPAAAAEQQWPGEENSFKWPWRRDKR